MRILIIEDEIRLAQNVASFLRNPGGYAVDLSSDGEDGRHMAFTNAYDLIILDLAMPGIDGLETLKRIKAKQPDAEIIMLTGQGSIRTSMEAMKLGAEDFLQKPVNIGDLMERINDAKDKRLMVMKSKSVKEIEKILHTKGW